MKVFKRIILIVIVVAVAGLYAYGVWPKAIYDTSVGSGSYITTDEIRESMSMSQSFHCPLDGLNEITIKVANFDRETLGDYTWTLTDAADQSEKGSGTIDWKELTSKGFLTLSFDHIEKSKGHDYTFEVQANNVQEAESVAFYMTTPGEYSDELLVEGKTVDQSSIIKMQIKRFNTETFIVFLGLALYVYVFIRFMYRLFK